MRSMGATIIRENDGTWVVDGVGVGGLLQPEAALEMGNSGTSTRLLMGLVATHPITTTFTGDEPHQQIGRAHVCTPVTNAHLVCRLLIAITIHITQLTSLHPSHSHYPCSSNLSSLSSHINISSIHT